MDTSKILGQQLHTVCLAAGLAHLKFLSAIVREAGAVLDRALCLLPPVREDPLSCLQDNKLIADDLGDPTKALGAE